METNMLEIPCKPHVKKYLEKNEFIKKPFEINRSSEVGIILMNLIEPKRKAQLPLRYRKGTVLEVSLGQRKEYNYKMWLPKKKAIDFNNIIDKLIRKDFYQQMENVMRYNNNIDSLIRAFVDEYDLSNTNLSFETLKRMFYRSRGASKQGEITS